MNVLLTTKLNILLDSLGIDYEDFQRFLVWALAEHLVSYLSRDKELIIDIRKRPDGLKQFRTIVRKKTHRDWSAHDIEALYQRVLLATEVHYRKPITYEDLIRLVFNSTHECAKCHRAPPDVKLHIDHIMPASKGGSSKYGNLQFLCQDCNLKKSNRLERTDEEWLNFE